MRKLALAAGAGLVLVLVSSTPASAGSSPRVRHIGNTVSVTRAGKSVEISAEYRCARTGTAKVSATVTQLHKNSAGHYIVTSVYKSAVSAAVCNDRYHSYGPKVTKTSGAALTTTGRTVVQVTLVVAGGPTKTHSGTAAVVTS